MATQSYLANLNMNKNELQNAVIQNLASAPSNPKEGQIYFNSADHSFYGYKNGSWVKLDAQGQTYTEGSGIDITSNVISIDNSVTGATKCKVTYNAQGLITSGNDLQASDIPNLTLSKITDVTVSASDVNSVTSKIDLTDLSVDSGSSNYLGYDNTTGNFSAKVDTTVGTVSTNLVTSGAVQTAINNAISTVYKAQGTIAFASLPTLGSSIEGYVYNVSDAFTTTSDFVEGSGKSYPAGTNVVCINTSGTTYKWDVLAGSVDTSSFITASSINTLINKTIDADDNTISDLTTSNLKSGVLQTTVRAVSSASDTSIASEKAIATALSGKTGKIEATNSALTASGGQCTWTISNILGTKFVSIHVYEVSSGDEVYTQNNATTSNITIKINSSSNIAENTYFAEITG